jgi:hypothetical protein
MPILILKTGAPLGRPEHHRKSPIEIALPTRDTAANIAKLPELLGRSIERAA